MFEHKDKPVISQTHYLYRLAKNVCIAFGLIALALLIGMMGYHYICGFKWIDSLLNASMILGGMGPVDVVTTNSGKIFASFYAIFSGIAFLSIIALILSPVVHRFLHKFHMDEEDEK